MRADPEVRAKAKAPARKRRAARPVAVPAAPASRNGDRASAPRSAEGQLMADLRSFVRVVGKDAARSLLNDIVDRL